MAQTNASARENPALRDLAAGDRFCGWYLLKSVQSAVTSGGKPYLKLRLGDLTGEFPAFHDPVYESALKHEFSCLETFRKIFAGGLLYDSLSGKSYRGTGFRDYYVAEGGETCCNTARGGIRYNNEIEQSRVIESAYCRACLGHLHERIQTFLHPCSA